MGGYKVTEWLATFGNLFPVWELSRGAGLTSFVLLTISMITGILHSFKFINKKVKTHSHIVHQYTGWFGILLGLTHGLVLLFNQDESLSLKEIFIPFSSHIESVGLGLGILSLYVTLLVFITSDFMKQVGKKLWRKIHYLSFPAYILALIHGLMLGPDIQELGVFVMYELSAGLVFLLFIFRISISQSKKTVISKSN